MPSQAIIFFDGKCNLCNRVVQFVLKHDQKGYFKFASLQSEFAQHQLDLKNNPQKPLRSLALQENELIYWRSTAALRIAKQLSGSWKLWSVLLVLPKFFRDPIYDFISQHRYKWFGKRSTCMRPDPTWQSRFIED